jgi:hypothetical protein
VSVTYEDSELDVIARLPAGSLSKVSFLPHPVVWCVPGPAQETDRSRVLSKTEVMPRSQLCVALMTAAGPGLFAASRNMPNTFVVTAKDSKGERLTTGGDPVLITADVTLAALQVDDKRNGLYHVSYTIEDITSTTAVGSFALSVMVRGCHIAGSPFAVRHHIPGWDVGGCLNVT